MAEQTMMERVAHEAGVIITRRIIQNRLDGYTLETGQEIARAAIEAMREPTREMLLGYIRHRGYDPDAPAITLDEQCLGVGLIDGWRAMIGGALAQG